MLLIGEILSSIKTYRSKIVIAGISVSWGLLLLILLVGTGQGLQIMIQNMFSDYTVKSLNIYLGKASLTGKSIAKGEKIFFTEQEIYRIKEKYSAIKSISPFLFINKKKVSSLDKEIERFDIYGVGEQYFSIKKINLNKGRIFNINDMSANVAIIGYNIAEKLFDSKNCIGNLIFIDNIGYKIIGVMNKGNFLSENTSTIFLPKDRAMLILGMEHFEEIVLSLTRDTNIQQFQNQLRAYLAFSKGFDFRDRQAVMINDDGEFLKQINILFRGINLFLWFISISFLISGMLGVFNVMTIIVKDRTREFGIRKAIGATPKSIQKMVLVESLLITLLSGLLGFAIGFVIVSMINLYINVSTNNNSSFILELNFPIIIGAFFLLILVGGIAGIIPARKASIVLPVEALRKGE